MHSCCSTISMNKVCVFRRNFKMNDIFHFWNIQTSGGEIRRDEKNKTAISKRNQGFFSIRLRHTPMKTSTNYSLFGQPCANILGSSPQVTKDNRRRCPQVTKQIKQKVQFIVRFAINDLKI